MRKHDSVPQKDIGDLLEALFKIKHAPWPDTAKILPGKLLLSVAPSAAYTLEGGGIGSLAFNISFFTGNSANTSLSVINTGGQYSIKKQLMLPVISNIWLPGNKVDLLGDWRYYKYPSYTYGLGGFTSLWNSDFVHYSYIKVYQEALLHFSSDYFIGAGYNLDYHFNIHDYTPVTDYPVYSGSVTQTKSSGLVLHFIYDSRANINNPVNASYISLLYRTNLTLLGSDNNWQYIQVEVRKYIRLTEHTVLALWTWNEFTFGGKAPYFDLPSNAWDTYSNTGRGYIQGRFRGPDMIYGETEFRFGITKNGLLGGVVFVNAESVTGWPNKTFGPFAPGEGAGIRIKFNKYSGVNVYIDYAFGTQGSNGLFFNLGEVF